jgi:hypothetical protein
LPLPKKKLTCRKCNNTLKNESIENIIFDKIPLGEEKDFKLFLYTINRYQNKEYKYINIRKNGIDYKNPDIYENRIIIRQLSQDNLICATYDKQLSLTSQSCYNLKIEKSNMPEFNHLYLLGIINSKLLSYYFIKSFGSYKKLFPRILLEKIKELPIKIPETLQEKELAIKISDLVKLLLENNKYLDYKTVSIQEKIDSLVFELFQITNDKKTYILKNMEEKLN